MPIWAVWSSVIFLVMHAKDAFFRNPPLAFRRHEFPYTFIPDEFEVFDFTHAVFRPIAVIEVPEPFARELRTMATVFSRYFLDCGGKVRGNVRRITKRRQNLLPGEIKSFLNLFVTLAARERSDDCSDVDPCAD